MMGAMGNHAVHNRFAFGKRRASKMPKKGFTGIYKHAAVRVSPPGTLSLLDQSKFAAAAVARQISCPESRL